MDPLNGGDILQPRGDPQFVGLTKLTYAAGSIPMAQGPAAVVEACTLEDFQECFSKYIMTSHAFIMYTVARFLSFSFDQLSV